MGSNNNSMVKPIATLAWLDGTPNVPEDGPIFVPEMTSAGLPKKGALLPSGCWMLFLRLGDAMAPSALHV